VLEQFPGDIVSGGKSSIRCWAAAGKTGSGRPLSLTMPSANKRMWPAGATMRLHQLPNMSRYGVIGTDGLVVR
jgi:hypothetical protein